MSEQSEQGSRLNDYLLHMLKAIHLARAYTEGMSKQAFLGDKRAHNESGSYCASACSANFNSHDWTV